MTPDREPDLPAHQFRVVDRDDAGVVRKEALVVDRPQFNERDRPIVLGVQNRDPKRLIGSADSVPTRTSRNRKSRFIIRSDPSGGSRLLLGIRNI